LVGTAEGNWIRWPTSGEAGNVSIAANTPHNALAGFTTIPSVAKGRTQKGAGTAGRGRFNIRDAHPGQERFLKPADPSGEKTAQNEANRGSAQDRKLVALLDTDLLLRETFVAQVEYHATLSSTNDRAKQCAAEGTASLPLLIVADEQTSGRGRGSNRWWTGKGSLACSLLLDLDDPASDRRRSALVALAAALAITETVAPLLPSHTVGLHWPNDVFAEGRKLAGVLVEGLRDRRLVVGIGLNVNNSLREAPPTVEKTATTLFELTGIAHDRTKVLVAILERLAGALREMISRPEQIAARANAVCLQHGQTLTIQTGRRRVCGRCRGIAADGALLLDTPEGREKLYSGVVLR